MDDFTLKIKLFLLKWAYNMLQMYIYNILTYKTLRLIIEVKMLQ